MHSITTWRSIVKPVEDGCRGSNAKQQHINAQNTLRSWELCSRLMSQVMLTLSCSAMAAMQLFGATQRLSPRVFHTATSSMFSPGRNRRRVCCTYHAVQIAIYIIFLYIYKIMLSGLQTRVQVRNRQWVLYTEDRVYILTFCIIHIALESNASVN